MTSPEDTAAETAAAAACHMPGHPGPAGQVNACQLCPVSPTYWRGQSAENTPSGERPCRWAKPTAAEVTP